jgi:hypothetical protein
MVTPIMCASGAEVAEAATGVLLKLAVDVEGANVLLRRHITVVVAAFVLYAIWAHRTMMSRTMRTVHDKLG